ncbi:hypothetical protein SULYE_0163 [Sulfurihydrogenibium yellowstonense SS-5]|uniref:Uncharacterized protein n=1 Tax=Sulfurihydrogenibium yellowstonense SS-5 TaxID=432331 RepID=C4FHY4_9AQUI|nr:hypothetical protein SULYE_0163 [Sulfurihydrogenibium yellowstonense SS-5]
MSKKTASSLILLSNPHGSDVTKGYIFATLGIDLFLTHTVQM